MIKVIDTESGTHLYLYQEPSAPAPRDASDAPCLTLGREGALFSDRERVLVNVYPGVYSLAELRELRDGIDEALRRMDAREDGEK